MNKKKILLSVVALILVCALSVAGTMALLKENAGGVINTFVAAGGDGPFVDANSFKIQEYAYTQKDNGAYEKGALVTGTTANPVVNQYKVLPGTVIPKEAFVTLSRTSASADVTPAPAYLFLEMKNDLNSVYDVRIDDENWLPVEINDKHITGIHGGKLFYYKDVLGAVAVGTQYAILDENQIEVSDDATQEQLGTEAKNLAFYAYLSQATATYNGQNTSDPAFVYATCFNLDIDDYL